MAQRSVAVSEFIAITDADPALAERMLEMSDGDVQNAVILFFENPELHHAQPAASGSRSRSNRGGGRAASGRRGRLDATGVIHIDSDDDGDDDDDDDDDVGDPDDFAEFADDSADEANGGLHAAARIAQEDEDAAMARRLQEEMYGGGGGSSGGGGRGGGADGGLGEDHVRSPIAQRTETLLGDDWDPSEQQASFEHASYQEQLQQQQRRQRRTQQAAARNRNPFAQSIWLGDADDDHRSVSREHLTPDSLFAASATQTPAATTMSSSSSRQQRLAELFRPPYTLMSHLDWDEARDEGKQLKKWILVNLQDMSDFNCQALNRDIWSNEAVKAIVKDHFLFLQYTRDDPLSEKYCSFYFPGHAVEDQDIYPHVCIVDPRTGEQVKVWSGRPFPSATSFHSQLADFLDRYSLQSGSKNPVVTEVQRTRTMNVDRMTEDEMLEMALKNSLESAGGGGGAGGAAATDSASSSISNGYARAIDPESLATVSKPRPPSPPPALTSLFAQISSTNPHSEPSADPASTTRIQFRHPSGRVIRRFSLADPVRTLFEWIKAEPIDGMPRGGEFELKAMPAGTDLIEMLDETVEAAGLKNGTVMIELITE